MSSQTTNIDQSNNQGIKLSTKIRLTLKQAETCLRKYVKTGKSTDMEKAIQSSLMTIRLAPINNPNHATGHSQLGACYSMRYQETGNLDDLEAGLKHNLLAVGTTLGNQVVLASRWKGLAMSYKLKFERTGDIKYLGAALKLDLAVVATTPKDHPESAGNFQNLAISFSQSYRRTGNMDDLEYAIQYNLLAIAATPEDHPELEGRRGNLSGAYRDKYLRTGNLSDLEAALNSALLIMAATPEGHPQLAFRQDQLALTYQDRYRRTGEIEDLKKALKFSLLAVAATADTHPEFAARQEHLAISYQERYKMTGNFEDLEASLKHSSLSMTATPEGHPGLAIRMTNMASDYFARYTRTGDFEDLEASVKYSFLAVSKTPEDHPDLVHRRQQLSISYNELYQLTGKLEILEAALKLDLLNVAETPEGHPDLAGRQDHLAISYGKRFKKTGNLEDLKTALKYNLLAVAQTADGHPDLGGRQNNLGVTYREKYKKTGNLEDLEAAIKHNLLAVSATPKNHLDLAGRQEQLALSYAERYKVTDDHEDLKKANTMFKSAINSSSAPPATIFYIAAFYTASELPFPIQDQLEAYSIAFWILPSIFWLGSSLIIRHNNSIRYKISAVASRAVGFALKHSQIRLAIEFYDQALAVTHKQKLQLKVNSTSLDEQYPELSKKFHEISFLLQGSSRSDPNVNYHTLANTRVQLLEQIHSCPGFERFLLPLQYPDLSAAAMYGPVVMFNLSNLGHAAVIIIMSPSMPPFHLPLPSVSESLITQYQQKIKDSLNMFSLNSREYRTGKPYNMNNISQTEPLHSVVTWIWTALVQPVFSVLANNGIHNGRLWWCPSGPFTYFPLHAAAPADSQFIQSYTPTLEFLIQANQKNIVSNDTLALVGISQTSSDMGRWTSLPSVQEELDDVTAIFGERTQPLMDSQATIQAVLERIQISSWLHLACHGHQDLENPLNSGLLLYDGKIDLQTILDMNLPLAKFVYLSACETAMGDSVLQNEAMHMAGGFLAAGFQGAIGTLWSIPDAYGPEVAEVVYRTIFGEDNVPDIRKAAEGLHLAVKKLREKGAPLHQWVPFIHLGI